MNVAGSELPVVIRSYSDPDNEAAIKLFARINRELAPPHLRERFEEYISTSISGEMSRLSEVFSATRRNAFWVVEVGGAIVGMFGIESRGEHRTELRRMYLDRSFRGRGIAQRMLQCAETQAVEFGFSTMFLSTAEIQVAALAFYRKCGYRLVRTEHVDAMSTKTVGGGIERYHFEKAL